MVVDVILVRRPTDSDPMKCSPRSGLVRNLSSKGRFWDCWNAGHDEFGCEAKSEKIIERWVVEHESRKSGRDCCHSGSKSSRCTSSNTLYKKFTLLLRSLYATVRLLPAYNLFHDLNSFGQIRKFNLAHRVHSFVLPFTHREEAEMQQFVFTPVDTSCGRLCLSVLYSSSLSDVGSEPSTPMSLQFIPDYVGSPMAGPLKRLPSLPVPRCSPSSSPFRRRHSLSYDLYGPSPPSAFPLPSPTCLDSPPPISKPSSYCLPSCLHHHLPETAQVYKNNTKFDEYWPSYAFSSSPSPSSPTYIPGSCISKTPLRSGNVPVMISESKIGDAASLSNKKTLPPPPSCKGTRLNSSKTDRSLSLVQTHTTDEKVFFRKDEIGKLSGVKISSDSSPQKSLTSSSSRVSLLDNLDDPELYGPFVVDDDDLIDPGSSSFDQKGYQSELHESGGLFPVRKPQIATVGALFCLLKKAPPLHLSNSRSLLQASHPETSRNHIQVPNQISEEPGIQHAVALSFSSGGRVVSKTTTDALEELRGYREVKDLLLRQGGRPHK